MNGQAIRPGRWLYGLAAVIFVSGWALFGVFLWKNLSTIDEGLQQVVVPGKVDLNLAKPGKYTIYYEHESVVGNRVYSTSRDISGLECSVVAKSSGVRVNVSRALVSSHYTVESRSGASFLEFRIDQPGIYELSAQYPEGEGGPEVVLAVGQGFGLKIVTTVLGSLAIVFGCIGLAVAIAVYTGVKRYNAGKRAQDRCAL